MTFSIVSVLAWMMMMTTTTMTTIRDTFNAFISAFDRIHNIKPTECVKCVCRSNNALFTTIHVVSFVNRLINACNYSSFFFFGHNIVKFKIYVCLHDFCEKFYEKISIVPFFSIYIICTTHYPSAHTSRLLYC